MLLDELFTTGMKSRTVISEMNIFVHVYLRNIASHQAVDMNENCLRRAFATKEVYNKNDFPDKRIMS